MTAIVLIDEIKSAIEEATEGIFFLDPTGKATGIKVFFQEPPIKDTDDEAEPFPYILIALESGSTSGISDRTTYKVLLVVAVWNGNLNNQGHRDVLAVIHRILERFSRNNLLPHFSQEGDMDWMLSDTNTYPYYFGGIEMTIVGHTIRRDNKEENPYL